METKIENYLVNNKIVPSKADAVDLCQDIIGSVLQKDTKALAERLQDYLSCVYDEGISNSECTSIAEKLIKSINNN